MVRMLKHVSCIGTGVGFNVGASDGCEVSKGVGAGVGIGVGFEIGASDGYNVGN